MRRPIDLVRPADLRDDDLMYAHTRFVRASAWCCFSGGSNFVVATLIVLLVGVTRLDSDMMDLLCNVLCEVRD